MTSQIPAFDLKRAERRIAAELDERWRRLRSGTAFVGGAEVEAFETAWAAFLGTAGCVGVANGTDALIVALRALDLRPGDEVVVPAFTFIAAASAVLLAGGTPVLADVEPGTLNLDAASVGERLTPRTVGVIGVHLYGRPFDLRTIGELCRRRGLWLIEDAAQAHGARWQDRPVGGFGRLATWSFYPSKNLGCFGDGGAVTGNDEELLARVRRLANHGRTGHYEHAEAGTNSRLDALQAAVLNCRLPNLAADNDRRREIACSYHGAVSEAGGVETLREPEEAVSVFHQYTVLSPRRDALKQHLAERGVGSAIHYPVPLHRQGALAGLPSAHDLPVAERAAREVLCLPMFAELTEAEAERVCAALRVFPAEAALAPPL